MNDEHRFACSVRRALDESAEHLPWRVTHRLEQARAVALARLPDAQERSSSRRAASGLARPDAGAHGSPLALVPRSAHPNLVPLLRTERPRLAWRLAVVAVPLTVVLAGLIGFSELASERSADEVAEVEAAVLADEVPISAYTDRGFGAYLKTSYQPEE